MRVFVLLVFGTLCVAAMCRTGVSCNNSEPDWGSSTGYFPGVMCGGGQCPDTELQDWSYSCAPLVDFNCLPNPQVVKVREQRGYYCLNGACTPYTDTTWGNVGKIGMGCPDE